MKSKIQLGIEILAVLILSTFAGAQGSAWHYSTKKNEMDGKVTEFAISNQVSGDANDTLVIACDTACRVYVTVSNGIPGNQFRIKFNDGTPKHTLILPTSDAIFFDDTYEILKEIRDNGGYLMIEHSLYGDGSVTAKFGIWNLPPTILARLDAGKSHVISAAEKSRHAQAAAIAKELKEAGAQ
jgi:hypothetical protein